MRLGSLNSAHSLVPEQSKFRQMPKLGLQPKWLEMVVAAARTRSGDLYHIGAWTWFGCQLTCACVAWGEIPPSSALPSPWTAGSYFASLGLCLPWKVIPVVKDNVLLHEGFSDPLVGTCSSLGWYFMLLAFISGENLGSTSSLVSWLIYVLLLEKIIQLYRRICRVLLCLLCTKLELFFKQQENCTINTQALPSWVVMPETLPLIQPEPMAYHCSALSWCR